MVEKKSSNVPGVDFSRIEKIADIANSGVWFTPFHPGTGEPLDCRILVYGEDSKKFARAMDHIAEQKARIQQRTGREETNYSDITYGRLILAMYLTGGWEGFVDGEKILECNDINKQQVYTAHPWLAEMVVEFARKRKNFMTH